MKRIVFIHPCGLHQIMGTTADLPTLPVTAENFVALGRLVPFASLVRVSAVAAYYKEPLVPASYSFHEAQR